MLRKILFRSLMKAVDPVPGKVTAFPVRVGGRKLQMLGKEERANVIKTFADMLLLKKNEILHANLKDIESAKQKGLTTTLIDQLSLKEAKLKTLSKGLYQIAENSYQTIGRVTKKTKLANNLWLQQITVPIGVIMVLFESKPDALPQIVALSIASANGLLLKGGDEAVNLNKMLFSLAKDALKPYDAEDAIMLIDSKKGVEDLLQQEGIEKHIDLIIPQGSNAIVKTIKNKALGIPILRNAVGVCHVYVDQDAKSRKTLKIVRDSKCQNPTASNAMDTLLVHESLICETCMFLDICYMLKKEKVKINAGPRLKAIGEFGLFPLEKSFRTDYGSLECTTEAVSCMEEAIDHIHKYGSGHTDVIITENPEQAKRFLQMVDTACVFHNVSTRFSDGYRFGLGADVGVSTSRTHVRGPVGVQGLLTTKWVLEGTDHTAEEFNLGKRRFKHEHIPITDDDGRDLQE